MTHQHRPCERDDLVALVSRQEYWHVENDGETGDFRSDGEYTGIEQYGCFNCGRWFEPEDPDRQRNLDYAWQAALDHLPKPDAPELTAMSCCFALQGRAISSRRGTK